ncbi:transcriptional regulator GcvA [Acuticoccus mangrovi]|uniref:Transcriptional regulator GcvA n=1 Tax=Acuticoccus mangrovi TaxID=2796142 RepID=A0A934MID1_9HYPH|nr:transcriptional regulator GcvA [Acuticoccus mangrovi]MBJ3777071.1 transcriptional regulator GcvA [Acuticoccus mangrovi]
MARRLPPLNALRALEAAGRHLSFTQAANELNVTPGAVSRQIKLLEETLGLQLFERKAGALEATPRCRDYAQVLSDVFSRIETATNRLTDVDRDRELCISASVTFTLLWLVPRMTAFHERHPEWQLRLTAAVPPPRLNDGGKADVFIQLNAGTETDLSCERLLGNDLIPVCSPALLESGPPLVTPADLNRHRLLHSLLRPMHWPHWLAAAGVTEVDGEAGHFHGTSALCYQAAIEGLGVAIAQLNFVVDDLVSGRLVTPFRVIAEDREAFHFIRGTKPRTAKLDQFEAWIFEEAARHEAWVRSLTADYQRLPPAC